MDRRYGLVGFPLAHSLSPRLHQLLFALRGEACSYQLFSLNLAQLSVQLPQLLALDGLSVTLPYKVTLAYAVDALDLSAKRYGTVNVVKREGKKTVGYNTDCKGFLCSIATLGATLKSRVLLLGCGATGRMVAMETALAGGTLTIAARPSSMEKAALAKQDISALTADASVSIVPIDGIPRQDFDLIINATPCGTYPDVTQMPVDSSVLLQGKFLFDVVYNPYNTKLIQEANRLGLKTQSGLAMLVHQAALSHKIWRGVSFAEDEIDTVINQIRRDLP